MPAPRSDVCADRTADLAAIGRGFTDERSLRKLQRGYLRHFTGMHRILDIGCGSGVFLDLLSESSMEAVGVDSCPDAAQACRVRGHHVVAADALVALAEFAQRGERFDGVLLSQMIEHLTPPQAADLLDGIAALLEPRGRLVVVSPNARNLIVLSEVFWLDPTHVRPYPRALIERLGTSAGFTVLESYDDPASVPRRGRLTGWIARLRSAFSGADRSGPMDSVVVLERL